MRQDEGNTFPLDAKLGLEVTQDVSEVYVKKLEERRRRMITEPRLKEEAGDAGRVEECAPPARYCEP